MIENLINKYFALVGTVGGWIIIGAVLVFIIAVICFKISKWWSFDTMYLAVALMAQSTNLLSSLSALIKSK